jgi:isoquinoline 1-oxidoreductase beta subunit
MMRRRALLTAAAGGLVALIGVGASIWTQVPVIPKRPDPDAETAIGWIAHQDGRFTLTLPRAEMGQNIATALKQIACTELGAEWDVVDVVLHATDIPRVKATVGSESMMRFAEPLAQACAALRDALAGGQVAGQVRVTPRPVARLRALRAGGLIGASPEITHGREIVTGTPLYAADVRLPGILYGRVLRAPASAEVRSAPLRWNLDAARAVPGFVMVVTDCGPPIGKAQGLGIIAARPGALDGIAEALAVDWSISGPHPHSDIARTIDVDARLARDALARGGSADAGHRQPRQGAMDPRAGIRGRIPSPAIFSPD